MFVKALLYCDKGNSYLMRSRDENGLSFFIYESSKSLNWGSNGKIVAECDIDFVELIRVRYSGLYMNGSGNCKTIDLSEKMLNKSCLTRKEFYDYLKKDGYALHLSNVKAFDEPEDINSFTINNSVDENGISSSNMLMKAPRNMCNVYDINNNHYILIPIQPQYLVKILNGEKDILIQKKILNVLKELIK